MTTAISNKSSSDPAAVEIQILREIAAGTAHATGDCFFQTLVEHVARALDVYCVFVTAFTEDRQHLRTMAVWADGKPAANFEYDVEGTPCALVGRGDSCLIPKGLRDRFPDNDRIAEMGGESYFGVPMIDTAGAMFGQLVVIDTRPMEHEPVASAILEIFASRAMAEIERIQRESALVASESRFRSLFEDAPVSYVTVDAGGRITKANRRSLRLFRRPLDELLGMHVSDLHPDTPQGKARSAAIVERFHRGEDVSDEELQILRGDGSVGWVALTVRALLDDQGRAIGNRSILVDITDRKQTETRLRQSEDKFRRILESAMDAIVAIDEDSRVVLFNGAAERTFRCTADAVMHEPLDRLVSDELREFIADYRKRARNKRGSQTAVWAPSGLKARRYDGETFPIEATFSRVELDTQTLDTIILRDVNDRAEAASQIQQLQSVTNYLREELESEQHYREIVGSSPALMDVLNSVEQVADTDAGVLILGETGTGKELIARAIHQASDRRDKPLIKVNCAAIPRTLVESELFGHEKGAFTGATRLKIGRFELADGGTIFLDEIGEIPNFVQVKLLRVLQERVVERVGGAEPKPIDVRVIAATNRNLEAEVRRGRFRADLYFRLNVFPMRVPSLRERREDIPQLAMHFVELYGQRFGRPVRAVSEESMARLVRYDWPGNIRELENVIERAVILAKGDSLDIPEQTLNLGLEAALGEDPPPVGVPAVAPVAPAAPAAAPAPPAVAAAPTATLEDVERQHIIAVLESCDWVIEGAKGAALILDMHPNTLRSRMKRLGIARKS